MTESRAENTTLLSGDEELIRAVRDGDTGAYATLYERHSDPARRLAHQLVNRETEVDDVVAETFTRVLSVVQRGGGPEDGFRPYLLTALRHVVYDRYRGEKRQVVTDDMERFDSGEPFVDPAVEGLEQSLIARAFLSLPERWQAVLWHTEIEGQKPAEVAPLLGVKANGVAALSYRAREGLRQAYLQMHLASGAPAEPCRPALERLGAYVRGGLAKRDTATVDDHLDDCTDCRAVYFELKDVNGGLRVTILPLVVGSAAAAAYAKPVGVLGGVFGGVRRRLRTRRQQSVAAGAGAAAAAVAVATALTVVSNEEPGQTSNGASQAAPPPAASEDAPDNDPGASESPSSDDPPQDSPAAGSGGSGEDAPAAPGSGPQDSPPAQEPGAPIEAGIPEVPDGSGQPETPEEPDEPEEPEEPETPEDPGGEEPDLPEVPEPPEWPGDGEEPEEPETPEDPGGEEPDLPEIPERPELPGVPEGLPGVPEVPESPEDPGGEEPDLPEVPERPELPEAPEESGVSEDEDTLGLPDQLG